MIMHYIVHRMERGATRRKHVGHAPVSPARHGRPQSASSAHDMPPSGIRLEGNAMVGTEMSDEDPTTGAALDVANGSSDDRAERYRRAKTGVTRFDGHFVVVVASTGI
jgi:hypothetical protein